MKKLFITFLVPLFGMMAYAQGGRAGINTAAPKTTLDVNGKTDTSGNLLSTDVTGLQAPRLTRAELTAKGNALYGTDQKGALVYIYDISGGDAVSQRVNIKSIGYYYFDGALWLPLSSIILNNVDGTGTVISINGVLQVAEEISVRLGSDVNLPSTANAKIGGLTIEVIDNYNKFTGTTTSNSFQVSALGSYLVNMNFSVQAQLTTSVYNGNLYYGVYNDTDNVWVAQNLQTVIMSNGQVFNLSFAVSMDLNPTKTYSFRTTSQGASAGTFLIRGQLNGNPTSNFAVKRLK